MRSRPCRAAAPLLAISFLCVANPAEASLLSGAECHVEVSFGEWAAVGGAETCDLGGDDGASAYASAWSSGGHSIYDNVLEAFASGSSFVSAGYDGVDFLGSRTRSWLDLTLDLVTPGELRDGWIELFVYGIGAAGFEGSLEASFAVGDARGDWEDTGRLLLCNGACGGWFPVTLGVTLPVSLRAELNQQTESAADSGYYDLAVQATFFEAAPDGGPGEPVSLQHAPEPSAVILAAMGLTAMAALRRFSRSRRDR